MEYNIPNSLTSVLRIASTSKQFTAACIVLLSQQGKLFKPLGMNDIDFYNDSTVNVKNRASGYCPKREGDGFVNQV